MSAKSCIVSWVGNAKFPLYTDAGTGILWLICH